MERAGPTPPGGTRPADLVAIVERPGPFATVWSGRSGFGAWGRERDHARAGEARSSLAEQGAPDDVLVAIDRAMSGVDPGAHGVVIIADHSGVLLTEELPEAPRSERAGWAPLPYLSAVLEHRQAAIPTIVVLADRNGADVVVNRPGQGERTEEITGDEYPVTKAAPGGWSQRRYQQRAQDSWERNADDVAGEVARLARTVHPDLVVLGGDERAVTLVRGSLPEELREITRTITSGRAIDRSEQHRDRDIRRLVDTVVASETVDVLQQFAAEDGRHQRAANGVDATFSALQQSQVDLLLVHDDVDDDRTAWFGPGPGQVAADRGAIESMTTATPSSARLVDVAIEAALRTGAGIRVVPDAAALRSGVGALLRWANEPAAPR
jgi:hypothetical protein